MSGVSAFWLYPIIVVAGILQAMGPPMNGALRNSLVNPWVATLVSFGLIVAVFIVVAAIFPRSRSTISAGSGRASMRSARSGRSASPCWSRASP